MGKRYNFQERVLEGGVRGRKFESHAEGGLVYEVLGLRLAEAGAQKDILEIERRCYDQSGDVDTTKRMFQRVSRCLQDTEVTSG